MTGMAVGILHPGNMGISVAASAQNSGCSVHWASENRSEQTRQRANEHNLRDLVTLPQLCAECDLVISVCPPHAADDVALQVLETGYAGLYLDANAISPQRATRIGELMTSAGVQFVDGGIVGGPAWRPGETWLYLAGDEAEQVADCFGAGPLETIVLGPQAGKASALKMCYAAYTKGTTALLAAILATAERLDVRQELLMQWDRDWPDFDQQTVGRVRRVTAKAWRFAGEMDEIAATFEQAGLPGAFHHGAAELYRRIACYKDAEVLPSLDDVLDALVASEGDLGAV